MKREIVGQHICSPIFIIDGFKWMMKLSPITPANCCHLDILLISAPPKIQTLIANYTVSILSISNQTITSIKKTNVEFVANKIPYYRRYKTTVFIEKNVLKDYNSPIIAIEIKVLKVQNTDKKEICDYKYMLNPSIQTIVDNYKWNIHKDDLYNKLIMIHSLELNLSVSTQRPYFFKICCKCTPNNIGAICMLYHIKVTANDSDFEYIGYMRFEPNLNAKKIRLHQEHIPEIIDLKLILIDIYDQTSMSVDINYMSNNNKNISRCSEIASKPFIWNVFGENTKSKYRYLCVGYIKKLTNKIITNDVINLCFNYYFSDKTDEIKEAVQGSTKSMIVCSSVFMIESFKWMMILEKQRGYDTVLSLKIIPIAIPSPIRAVKVKWNVLFCEANCSWTGIKLFNKRCVGEEYIYFPRKAENCIKTMNKMTIKASIIVLSVKINSKYIGSQQNSSITNFKQILNRYPSPLTVETSDHYKFCVNGIYLKQKKMKFFLFEMHSIKWCLLIRSVRIRQNYHKFWIELKRLSTPKQIAFCQILCQFGIFGKNKQIMVKLSKLNKTNKKYKTYFVHAFRLKSSDSLFDINLNMKLIDVYPKNGKIMMSKILNPSYNLHYEWMIPRLNEHDANYICNGFIRKSINKYIPYDIVKLCQTFLYDDSRLNEIINSDGKVVEKSDILQIESIECVMVLEKNNDEYAWHQSKEYYCYIELTLLPPRVAEVICKYTMKLGGTEIICEKLESYNPNKRSCYFWESMSWNSSQMPCDLTTLRIIIDLSILDIRIR